MQLAIRKIMAAGILMILSMGAASVGAVEQISLQDLREEVLDENLDIKIQYEHYYQAQKNVNHNLGQFLPNFSPQLFFWNTTYGILYALSPNPSSWFQYRASNEMALAERYATEAVKLNILSDLSSSYVSIKYQEEMLDSLREQVPALQKAYEEALASEELGVGDANEVFLRERRLMRHRQEILVLEAAIALQKEGLLMALNRSPSEDLELAPLVEDNGEMLPPSVEEAIHIGLSNAPELVANEFMAEGAKYMNSAARWSFVSFSGIGFGYPSLVAIERSKAREIELEREKTENQIGNQIAAVYEQLDIVDRRIELQRSIVDSSLAELDRAGELLRGSRLTRKDFLKAQDQSFEEARNLIKLEMEKRLLIVKAKRLLGFDATMTERDTLALEAATLTVDVRQSFNGKRVSVNVEMPPELAAEVVSVVYGGDIFDYRIVNTSGNFGLFTRTHQSGRAVVSATLLLSNGQRTTLSENIEL